MIFLAPLLGAALGAAVGGTTGALTDLGYGGRVIQGSLSTEAEQKLQEALSASGTPT